MTTVDGDTLLWDEPNPADLNTKVRDAWRDFATALSGLLPTLPPEAYLDLTLDPTASGTGDAVYTVSVRAAEAGDLEALAVGNASLPDGYRMDRETVARLIALGWSPPGVIEDSGDHFGYQSPAAEAQTLASLATRTLRDIYGAPHPAFLVYLARDAAGEPLTVAPLGTARLGGADLVGPSNPGPAAESADTTDITAEALEKRVREVIGAMLDVEPDKLPVDSDGDLGIRAGSAMVFVRVRDNPPLVDVFSPVLTGVEASERLYVRLSELTNRMPIGRLYYANDTVWASLPVIGRAFQTAHLVLAVTVMTGLADELDDRLHGEFGGKRFFAEGDKPTPAQGDQHRTGMYL